MDTHRRVLIVDDDVDFAEALADTLDPSRYQTHIAHSTDEALKLSRALQPPVALIDIRLNQSSGIELVRTLKQEQPDLLCVIMTAYADVDTAVDALKSGAYDYLRKPIHPPDLWATLDRCFDKVRLEREKAETLAALRESEDRYRSIFENALVGVFRCTPDGRFTHVNPALVEMLGYDSADDLLRLTFPDDLYADPAACPPLQGLFEPSGALRGAEMTWRKRDGTQIIVSVEAVLRRNAAGAAVACEGLVQDVTARRRVEAERAVLQEQLFQSQKMESVGTLAGGIAHDFNNLLTAILGNTQLTRADLPPDHPTQLFLSDSESAAHHAAALIRQLLAFSRRQRLERAAIDVNSLLSSFTTMLQRIIGEHIEISLHLSQSPAIVFADAVQIEQVIMNLAVNARDAMPGGGRLRFETAHVWLDAASYPQRGRANPGRYVRLTVSDTGHGMDAQTRLRIFEPFFTTKEVNRGTGLGLAVAYGIVNQHDGMIHAYSEPGMGAVFHVYLPAINDPALDADAPGVAPRSLGNETILVAEDEAALRNLAQRVLTGLGYTVLTAHDGVEALRLLEAYGAQIRLAILDLIMPRVGGYEVYEQMRQRGVDLPVLFVTGYSADTARDTLAPQPGVAILQKPYGVQEIGARVRELLDGAPGGQGQ